jgi:hypothetical protein
MSNEGNSTDNTTPTIKEADEKEQVYWQVHIDCIRALAKVGISYHLNQRIQPFFEVQRLKHLRKVHQEIPLQDLLEASSQLARLVLYRTEGYEPELLKETYT